MVMAMALPRWQRWSIYASVGALLATGLLWLVVAWPPGSDGDALSATQRAVAGWALRSHGVVAYAMLVVAGSVLPVHLRLGWTRGRNRVSGGILAALLLVLATSGLWLYYGTGSSRSTVSLLHWLVGLALPIWLGLHRTLGLRARRGRSGAES